MSDREFCETVRRVHHDNRTLNHEEDSRAIWTIMYDGLRKLRSLNLRMIIQAKK